MWLFLYSLLDATTGATDDWAKAVPGVKYPFNPELRGNDFVIDKSQIGIAFEETFAGLVGMTNAIPFGK